MGCNTSYSHNIPCPTPISVVLDSLVDVSCFGLSDGEIYITVSGGTPSLVNGYNYSWNGNVFTSEDLTGISAGSYNVESDRLQLVFKNFFGINVDEPALLETNILKCY